MAWLKAVPPFFAHEGRLLARLAGGPVPRLLGQEGGRVLLAEIAGEDLYEAGPAQLLDMVALLVGLQRSWQGRVEELLALGLPDWRAPALEAAIAAVVERTADELAASDRAVLAGLPAQPAAPFRRHRRLRPGRHAGAWRFPPWQLPRRRLGDHPARLGRQRRRPSALDQPAFLTRIPDDAVGPVRAHWHGSWRDVAPGADPDRAAALLAPVAAARQAVIYQGFLDRIEPAERVYHRIRPRRLAGPDRGDPRRVDRSARAIFPSPFCVPGIRLRQPRACACHGGVGNTRGWTHHAGPAPLPDAQPTEIQQHDPDAPAPAGPKRRRRFSEVLQDLAAEGGERIAIADILTAFGDRAFGALMLVFAVPNILPTPPGTSSVLGAPLLFITFQLMIGRPVLWLPRMITRRSVARADFARLVERMVPWLAKAERLLRPRLSLLIGPVPDRFIGAACLLLAIILFMPIPLGNMVPALAISAFAIGLVERDGVAVSVGWAVSAGALAILVAVSAALWAALRAFLETLFGVSI